MCLRRRQLKIRRHRRTSQQAHLLLAPAWLKESGMSRFSFSCFGSRVLSWLMACLLAFATSNTPASAQMACPQGVTPGSSQCLPTGGAQQSQPPVPKPRWRLTWGAIAMSSRTGEVGTSVGRFSKREATREAMEKCQHLGGKECEIAITYRNQCAVVAWASEGGAPTGGAAFVQGAATISEASELAISACSKSRGGGECSIVYSACSEPLLVH